MLLKMDSSTLTSEFTEKNRLKAFSDGHGFPLNTRKIMEKNLHFVGFENNE